MSRRASLPGAEELFRRTERPREKPEAPKDSPQVDKAPKLQVATTTEADPSEQVPHAKKAPRHEEKVTFYCTSDDLMALERARLTLRAEHGIAADRGRIVRANPVLEQRLGGDNPDTGLLRRLHQGRYPRVIEHPGEVQPEHLRAGRAFPRERFDVAVDVIDGRVARLERQIR